MTTSTAPGSARMRALIGGKEPEWVLDGTKPIQKIDAGLIGGDPTATTEILEAFS